MMISVACSGDVQEEDSEEGDESSIAANWQEAYYTLLVLEKIHQHAPKEVMTPSDPRLKYAPVGPGYDPSACCKKGNDPS
jgi:hypothetical protein